MVDFKHLLRYVAGAVELELAPTSDRFARVHYIRGLATAIAGYLQGCQRLDSSFTPFEHDLALDAAAVFGGPVAARNAWHR